MNHRSFRLTEPAGAPSTQQAAPPMRAPCERSGSIHVARGGQRFGPYAPAEIHARLAAGELAGTDFGWHEGLGDWMPLAQILGAPACGFPARPRPQRSGVATTSFVIALLGIPFWVVLFGAAGVAAAAGAAEDGPLMVAVGMLVLGGMLVNLTGVLLGIVGLTGAYANRWMGAVGLALHGVELLGVLALMAIGLAMG